MNKNKLTTMIVLLTLFVWIGCVVWYLTLWKKMCDTRVGMLSKTPTIRVVTKIPLLTGLATSITDQPTTTGTLITTGATTSLSGDILEQPQPAPKAQPKPQPKADNCPNGDYTGNRYDGRCGTKPQPKPTPKPTPAPQPKPWNKRCTVNGRSFVIDAGGNCQRSYEAKISSEKARQRRIDRESKKARERQYHKTYKEYRWAPYNFSHEKADKLARRISKWNG